MDVQAMRLLVGLAGDKMMRGASAVGLNNEVGPSDAPSTASRVFDHSRTIGNF